MVLMQMACVLFRKTIADCDNADAKLLRDVLHGEERAAPLFVAEV